MTLRGVIQGLLRGSDDAEAMLADEGYGDLPAEMFGQALSSYADTAPMDEADALSPLLTSIDAGDASDVFAMLEEQPLTLDAPGPDAVGLSASIMGAAAVDDALDTSELDELDDFGAAAPEDADDLDGIDAEAAPVEELDELDDVAELAEADDPFTEDNLFDTEAVADTTGEFAEEADFFETEPTTTDEDLGDLDF